MNSPTAKIMKTDDKETELPQKRDGDVFYSDWLECAIKFESGETRWENIFVRERIQGLYDSTTCQQYARSWWENIDWAGHWRVIIGYDTMGTETTADDVIILADSYDTGDHLQDGCVVNSVEKFYYTWYDSDLLPKDQKKQQWLIATPPVN